MKAIVCVKQVPDTSGKVAVKDVSLHVQEGEIVTLIGANGAGKSTVPVSYTH